MIDAAFSWIGEIARFLGRLLPRPLIVKSSHGAVKYVRGYKVIELKPGWHLYWPIMTEVEMSPVVRQVLNLPTQLLETSDGATVAVSGMIEYEVDDVICYLAECENAYESIDNVATAAIREVVTKLEHADLRAASGSVDRLLTNASRRVLKDYGVYVLKARLSDFARVRPLHITGGQEFGPIR